MGAEGTTTDTVITTTTTDSAAPVFKVEKAGETHEGAAAKTPEQLFAERATAFSVPITISKDEKDKLEETPYGLYDDLSFFVAQARGYLHRQVEKHVQVRESLFKGYADFGKAISGLKNVDVSVLNGLLDYADKMKTAGAQMEALLAKTRDDLYAKYKKEKEEEDYDEYEYPEATEQEEKGMLREMNDVNLALAQMNYNMKILSGISEDTAERYLQATRSMHTVFSDMEELTPMELLKKATSLTGLLLYNSYEYVPRFRTAEERVNTMHENYLKVGVDIPSQPSDKELAQAAQKKAENEAKFQKRVSFADTNACRMINLPEELRPDNQALPKEERERISAVYAEQIAKMNECSLMVSALSKITQTVERNTDEDSIRRSVSDMFFDMLFGIRTSFYRLSLDAETLYDEASKEKNEKERTKKIDTIVTRLAAVAENYGKLAQSMVDVLRGNDFSLALPENLVAFKSLKEKCMEMLPPEEKLRNMEPNFDASEKRCNNLISAIDETVRAGRAILTPVYGKRDIAGVSEEVFSLDTVHQVYSNIATQEEIKASVVKKKDAEKAAASLPEKKALKKKRKEYQKHLAELKRQEDALKAEQAYLESEKQNQASISRFVKNSSLTQLTGTMQMHIPAKEMKSLKEFTVGSQKRKGVGKMRAFSLRHFSVSGGKLVEAVKEHADRMLESDLLTDRAVASGVANLIESTGIFSKRTEPFRKQNTELNKRLALVERFNKITDDDEIIKFLPEVRKELGNIPDTELPLDDPYFISYPHAAKIIYMHKLLDNRDVNATTKAELDFKERLLAVRAGLDKARGAIINSPDYKRALVSVKLKKVAVERHILSSRMFEEETLVNAQAQTAEELYAQYIEGDREYTQAELQKMTTYTKRAKDIVTERNARRAKEKGEFEKKTEAEKRAHMLRNYKRMLAGYSQFSEGQRMLRLTSFKPKEETFAQKGGKNAETILLDQITEVLADQYALADIADTFVEDRKLIGKLLVKQMIADGFAAVKSKDDIKKLTAEQLREYASLLTLRIGNAAEFMTKVATQISTTPPELSEKQRSYILTKLISGEQITVTDAANYFASEKQRSAFLRENKDAVLYGGQQMVQPRVFFDLTGLKASKKLLGDTRVRAINRFERMRSRDTEITAALKELSVQVPMSLYEFAERLYMEKGTDLTQKVASKKEKEARALFIDPYKEYITQWEKTESARPELTKEQKSELKDIAKAFKKHETYLYFGVEKYGKTLVKALGESLNGESQGDFEEGLFPTVFTKILKAESALVKYCVDKGVAFNDVLRKQMQEVYLEPDFEKRMRKAVDKIAQGGQNLSELISRKDRRIEEYKRGNFAVLLPVLMESKTFTDHLVADDDDAFADYEFEMQKKAAQVIAELNKHIYLEQYLLGKKDAIISFLETDDDELTAEQALDLTAYDDEIIHTEIKKGVTLDSVIHKAIEASRAEKNTEAKTGNLYIMALLYDGANTILSPTKMKAYKERVQANTEALEKALERAFATRPYDAARREAVSKAIMNNERVNLFMSETYDADKQVADWLTVMEADRAKIDAQLALIRQAQEDMKKIVQEKAEGREALLEFVKTGTVARAKAAKVYSDGIALMGKERTEDASRILYEKLPETTRKLLDDLLTTEKDRLPANGALNSFYDAIIARVVYECFWAKKKGVADALIMKEHVLLDNVRSFYDICDRFLDDKEHYPAFEGLKGESKLLAINGLMNLYGTSLVDPGYKVTEDRIREELDKMFSEPNTARVFLAYLKHDNGSIYGIGNTEDSFAESSLGLGTPQSFGAHLDACIKIAKHKKSFTKEKATYDAMDAETKKLVGHLLVREEDFYNPAGYVISLMKKQSMQANVRTDMILTYLKGETLADPDYRRMANAVGKDEKASYEHFREAIKLAQDVANMRASDGFFADEEIYREALKSQPQPGEE